MANNTNLYKVGDYVYFETAASTPYAIRRIEELNKAANGSVEAKVMCFFRRGDIPAPLLVLADRHDTGIVSKPATAEENGHVEPEENDGLTPEQRHKVKHRELFLSRQVETLPASQIRGKCYVTLLNETEDFALYLAKEDTFFYSLVYDIQQKTLLADRGEIRVGTKYQADPATLNVKPNGESERRSEDWETLVWNPENPLTDEEIDQFVVLAKSVGTYARSSDSGSAAKLPGLHMTAAAASRDITKCHAMKLLHQLDYDFNKAVKSLVPTSGPLLVRDEMEDWSGSESRLFEEAVEKYGKDFVDIRRDFLPWKSMKNIVEFYYLWKTTDFYVLQRRVKAVEADAKLKQVYVPNYEKETRAVNGVDDMGRPCESCTAPSSPTWHPYGSTRRLCGECWKYWKKFCGFPSLKPAVLKPDEPDVSISTIVVDKLATTAPTARQEAKKQMFPPGGRNVIEVMQRSTNGEFPRPIMKTRAAFSLKSNAITKLARTFCRDIIKPRRLSRVPARHVSFSTLRATLMARTRGISSRDMEIISLRRLPAKKRVNLLVVSLRLGQPVTQRPGILRPNDRTGQQPKVVAYPKPEKRKDGSLIYEELGPSSGVKRKLEDPDEPEVLVKKPAVEGAEKQRSQHKNQTPQICVAGRRGNTASWVDAPADVYFRATAATKSLRKKVEPNGVRKAARCPWKIIKVL